MKRKPRIRINTGEKKILNLLCDRDRRQATRIGAKCEGWQQGSRMLHSTDGQKGEGIQRQRLASQRASEGQQKSDPRGPSFGIGRSAGRSAGQPAGQPAPREAAKRASLAQLLPPAYDAQDVRIQKRGSWAPAKPIIAYMISGPCA